MGGRLKAALVLVAMFALGAFVGVRWERYETYRLPMYAIYPNPRLQSLYNELALTPDQQKQMDAIFQKAHERATQINEEVAWDLEDVHRDSISAIEAILTPDQRIRFDSLRHRLLAKHHHHRPQHLETPSMHQAQQ